MQESVAKRPAFTPPPATVEKPAAAVNVPLPYIYCDDDRLAEILIRYAAFDDNQKDKLLMHVTSLSTKAVDNIVTKP